MILSTNFFAKKLRIFFLVFITLSGCQVVNHQKLEVVDNSPAVKKKLLTAVLPFANLSGTPAPLEDLRHLLIKNFKEQGLNLVDEEVVGRSRRSNGLTKVCRAARAS